MNITLTDAAKRHLQNMSNDQIFSLAIEDGCCGKAFAFDMGTLDTNWKKLDVDGTTFYLADDVETLAPEISIDVPGPTAGLMITNLKAIGGCACGRSFFIE